MPTLGVPMHYTAEPLAKRGGTQTDWPVLDAVLASDSGGRPERPTSSATFALVIHPVTETDVVRVRRSVNRALREFGPAFDRLGTE